MEIKHFDFGGESLPVAFPFEAMMELMGPNGFAEYSRSYQSPTHQVKVLGVGLKYGHMNEGIPFKLKDKQILALAKAHMPSMVAVWKMWDRKLTEFIGLFAAEEPSDPSTEDEGKPLPSVTLGVS